MTDKPESIYWAKVWWVLAADHMSFDEVLGDFRKKYPADWFQGGKDCKDLTGKSDILHWKNIAHDVYNAEKNLTPLYVKEKISNSRGLKNNLTQFKSPIPLPPQKSNEQPHRGWGRKRIDTVVDVICQQNSWRAFIMWRFSRLKFCILRLKYADKRHKWKEKGSKECSDSFLWTNENLSLWGIQPCFLQGGSDRLACFEPTHVARFLKKLEVHSVPYGQGKYVFETEVLCL